MPLGDSPTARGGGWVRCILLWVGGYHRKGGVVRVPVCPFQSVEWVLAEMLSYAI
jgi:hypothetical protein